MTSSNLPPPPSVSLSSLNINQSAISDDGPINSKEPLQQAPGNSSSLSTSLSKNHGSNKQQAQQQHRHSCRSRSNSYTLQSASLKILPEDIPIESINLSSTSMMSNNTHNTLFSDQYDMDSRRRSSSLSSGDDKDTYTKSLSTNTTTDYEKKRESWQINTDWDYNNLDNSFNNSQASLYYVLGKFAFVYVFCMLAGL